VLLFWVSDDHHVLFLGVEILRLFLVQINQFYSSGLVLGLKCLPMK
jgi:hypothetical protein